MTYKHHSLDEQVTITSRLKSFLKLFALLAIAFLVILLILPYFEKYMLSK